MGPQCIDGRLIELVASGRCFGRELAAVRAHLGQCARCRARVVAAAQRRSERPVAADTVLLRRPSSGGGAPGRAFQLAWVALSVGAVAAAWLFGVNPVTPALEPESRARAAEPPEVDAGGVPPASVSTRDSLVTELPEAAAPPREVESTSHGDVPASSAFPAPTTPARLEKDSAAPTKAPPVRELNPEPSKTTIVGGRRIRTSLD